MKRIGKNYLNLNQIEKGLEIFIKIWDMKNVSKALIKFDDL